MASHLFIVDSSPAVQRLIEQASASEGYDVVAFKDGATALDAASRLKPELVIADYHLDDIAFSAFCEQLKTNKELEEAPIIALVGAMDRPDEKHLQSLGVRAFLNKPLQADDLMAVMRKLRAQPAPERSLPGRPLKAGLALSSGATSNAAAEDADGSLAAQLLRSLMEQTERTVARLLPDLVAREVEAHLRPIMRTEISSQLEALASREEIARLVQETARQILPDLVVRHLSALESKVQRDLVEGMGQSVRELTAGMVSEFVEPAVRQQLPEALKRGLTAGETPIPETVRKILESVVREIVPDLAEAEVKKEIERLTA